jgi:hypothetical protein
MALREYIGVPRTAFRESPIQPTNIVAIKIRRIASAASFHSSLEDLIDARSATLGRPYIFEENKAYDVVGL